MEGKFANTSESIIVVPVLFLPIVSMSHLLCNDATGSNTVLLPEMNTVGSGISLSALNSWLHRLLAV